MDECPADTRESESIGWVGSVYGCNEKVSTTAFGPHGAR
jgi:hypothetical protein